MKITFFGTGTSMGVPVIACNCAVCHSSDANDRRLRTSALIEIDGGRNILIDIGPDFRQQMLRHDIKRLDAILITHAHRDHVAGLDDIRSLNYAQQAHMQLYGNAFAFDILRHDYHYIFGPHPYDGLPEADLHEVTGEEPFMAAGEEIVPIRALHNHMPVLGYRVGPIVYITDASHIDDNELAKAAGCELLVINALRQTKHFSHFSLPEALEVVQKVAPRQAYITHISHEMGFHREVNRQLPPNVWLAYDGLELTI